MTEDAILDYVVATFPGVDAQRPKPGEAPDIAVGDTFFIYDPERNLEGKYRFPFATIVTKDYGEHDKASNLNRPGVFRLNIGVCKETYRKLFGPQPSPVNEGETAATGHDFAALDVLMPHPVYASQSWVCVLNPGEATFASLKPLLQEAYEQAVKRLG